MARFLSLVAGVVLTGLGVWAAIAWWGSVLVMLRAAVAVLAVLVGLGVVVFALSDLWTGRPESAPPPAALPEGPGESA